MRARHFRAPVPTRRWECNLPALRRAYSKLPEDRQSAVLDVSAEEVVKCAEAAGAGSGDLHAMGTEPGQSMLPHVMQFAETTLRSSDLPKDGIVLPRHVVYHPVRALSPEARASAAGRPTLCAPLPACALGMLSCRARVRTNCGCRRPSWEKPSPSIVPPTGTPPRTPKRSISCCRSPRRASWSCRHDPATRATRGGRIGCCTCAKCAEPTSSPPSTTTAASTTTCAAVESACWCAAASPPPSEERPAAVPAPARVRVVLCTRCA